MITFPHGERVTRLRGTPVTDPYSGEATDVSWDDPDELVFDRCSVWQDSSIEPVDSLTSRTEVVTVTKCAVPFDADIEPGDRFRARSKTYEVQGEIERMRSPFNGWEPGAVVTGRRIDG
jgi:hypothetical protein